MQNIPESMNTPAMRQFLDFKKNYPDAILFFRLGDFYEMFMDDAVQASTILDIALTRRQKDIPMCGIPYHATESYIARLLSAGKKIVIIEQIREENAPSSKIMKREVVRVVTPGTVIEDNLLTGYANNFLCAGYFLGGNLFLSFGDVSTSDLYTIQHPESDHESISASLLKFGPREILALERQKDSVNIPPLKGISLSLLKEELMESQKSLFTDGELTVKSMLSHYIRENFKKSDFTFRKEIALDQKKYMELDENTIRNLELVPFTPDIPGSLFDTLNHCITPKGKRVLKNRILFPVLDEKTIRERWVRLDSILDNKKSASFAREQLRGYSDLERILSRFRGGKALPRDFRSLERNLEIGIELTEKMKEAGYTFHLNQTQANHLLEYFRKRILEGELPAVLGGGPFLKRGYNPRLDQAQDAKAKGRQWILDLEEKTRKETGLSTLKIRYNKVVGYYAELSRAQSGSAPNYFQKKQTLVTSERYTFPALEKIEKEILEADHVIDEIETEEFTSIVLNVLENSNWLLEFSDSIGTLDFTQSIAHSVSANGWIRPTINDKGIIDLSDSRHPVVEQFLPSGEVFVPNSVYLDGGESSIAILTGPNMAGKSTYMKQIAINMILFQIGSYLPARNANLCITDKIFTRIGSADNLTKGESTFYLEMKETSRILSARTEKSLILFDEVGRGTSTYDGMSLAWSILEYMSSKSTNGIRTKTIFATHYHELTELEKEPGIFNLYMDILEEKGEITFLKKAKKGRSKKSFGLYVAKLAGLPEEVILRAGEVLETLESRKREIRFRQEKEPTLFPFFTAESPRKEESIIEKRLKTIAINNTTPIQALQILEELIKSLK